MAMRRMQAAGIEVFGGDVRVLDFAAPSPPAPDEVVISVRAAGVGNWDEIVRVGGWDVGSPSVGGRGRVPGARAHRRPGAHRGRACAGWRMGARARRRRRDRRTHRATRDRARSNRRRDGAGPSSVSRVRGYGARVVLDYLDPGWPARVRDASPGGHGVGGAVNAAPGGAAIALQAVASNGRLATITGDRRHPNEESRSRMSTSDPTAHG
jgi:NADPH:quinone reductase-like Zn-dependent oxidoreductase